VRNLKWLLFLCVLVIVMIASCDTSPTPTLPPATPGGGWILQTVFSINGSLPVTAPGVTVTGQFISDQAGAAGDPRRVARARDFMFMGMGISERISLR
jgi:hypothetical protein